MVRHVKDPGINLPAETPHSLPPTAMMQRLAELDRQSKAGRVTPGFRKNLACAIDSQDKAAFDQWAEETAKTQSQLLRELVVGALACRARGRSPLAILQDSSREAG